VMFVSVFIEFFLDFTRFFFFGFNDFF